MTARNHARRYTLHEPKVSGYFDLFLFCVLQNKRDLAFEMWKRVWFPIRAAMVAVSQNALLLCHRTFVWASATCVLECQQRAA